MDTDNGEDYTQRRFKDIYDALKNDIESNARSLLKGVDREKRKRANETTVD